MPAWDCVAALNFLLSPLLSGGGGFPSAKISAAANLPPGIECNPALFGAELHLRFLCISGFTSLTFALCSQGADKMHPCCNILSRGALDISGFFLLCGDCYYDEFFCFLVIIHYVYRVIGSRLPVPRVCRRAADRRGSGDHRVQSAWIHPSAASFLSLISEEEEEERRRPRGAPFPNF